MSPIRAQCPPSGPNVPHQGPMSPISFNSFKDFKGQGRSIGPVTLAGKKLDSFRPPPMLCYRPHLFCHLLLSLYCHWSRVFWPPVIGWAFAKSHGFLQWLARPHQWVIPPSQGYVIVHSAMLSSRGLCFHPKVYVIVHRAMLSSTGLWYRPNGYFIVHRAMLSYPGHWPMG